MVGGSWEGFVIENLLACVPPRTEASFYRSSGGAEVDLVLTFRDSKTWAVEIQRGLTPVLRRAPPLWGMGGLPVYCRHSPKRRSALHRTPLPCRQFCRHDRWSIYD